MYEIYDLVTGESEGWTRSLEKAKDLASYLNGRVYGFSYCAIRGEQSSFRPTYTKEQLRI